MPLELRAQQYSDPATRLLADLCSRMTWCTDKTVCGPVSDVDCQWRPAAPIDASRLRILPHGRDFLRSSTQLASTLLFDHRNTQETMFSATAQRIASVRRSPCFSARCRHAFADRRRHAGREGGVPSASVYLARVPPRKSGARSGARLSQRRVSGSRVEGSNSGVAGNAPEHQTEMGAIS